MPGYWEQVRGLDLLVNGPKYWKTDSHFIYGPFLFMDMGKVL